MLELNSFESCFWQGLWVHQIFFWQSSVTCLYPRVYDSLSLRNLCSLKFNLSLHLIELKIANAEMITVSPLLSLTQKSWGIDWDVSFILSMLGKLLSSRISTKKFTRVMKKIIILADSVCLRVKRGLLCQTAQNGSGYQYEVENIGLKVEPLWLYLKSQLLRCFVKGVYEIFSVLLPI